MQINHWLNLLTGKNLKKVGNTVPVNPMEMFVFSAYPGTQVEILQARVRTENKNKTKLEKQWGAPMSRRGGIVMKFGVKLARSE